MKKYLFLTTVLILLQLSNKLFSQDVPDGWTSQNIGSHGYSVKFSNTNLGFVAVNYSNNGTYYMKILKTVNKGISWSTIWPDHPSISNGIRFDAVDENHIYVYYNNSIFRTNNGGASWNEFNLGVFGGGTRKFSAIKFANANTGYATYTDIQSSNNPELKFIKTTNGGATWEQKYSQQSGGYNYIEYIIKDITFAHDNNNNNNANVVTFVGYNLLVHNPNYIGTYKVITSTGLDQAEPFIDDAGGVYQYTFQYINTLPGNPGEQRILSTTLNKNDPNDQLNGTYCNFPNGNPTKITSEVGYTWVAGLSYSSYNNGYTYINDKIYRTTNSGINWFIVNNQVSAAYEMGNSIFGFNEISYVIDYAGNFLTRLVSSTSFQTIYNGNNPDGAGSMIIDGNPIPTPFHDYWRGGYTSLNAPLSLNNGNEVFPNWFNKQLNPSINFYFDNSGNTFSANYKSKLKADNPWAISNASQTKSTRDTLGYIHVVQESDEGIFYTRSTDNGSNFNITSFSREEVVNAGPTWNSQFPNDASGFNN
jgi:hypothetical protein